MGIITETSGFREVDDQSRPTQRSHGVEQMPKLSSIRKSWDCKSKYGSKQHFSWVKLEMMFLNDKRKQGIGEHGAFFSKLVKVKLFITFLRGSLMIMCQKPEMPAHPLTQRIP